LLILNTLFTGISILTNFLETRYDILVDVKQLEISVIEFSTLILILLKK